MGSSSLLHRFGASPLLIKSKTLNMFFIKSALTKMGYYSEAEVVEHSVYPFFPFPRHFDKPEVWENFLRQPLKVRLVNKRSKLADVVSVRTLSFPSQMMVSQRFLKLLQETQGVAFRAAPMAVYDIQDIAHPYWLVWFNPDEVPLEVMDYKKTLFQHTEFHKDSPSYTLSDIHLPSATAFIKARQSMTIGVKKIAFHEEALARYEHFHLGTLILWIAKEAFVEKLRAAGITGLAVYRLTPETVVEINHSKYWERVM